MTDEEIFKEARKVEQSFRRFGGSFLRSLADVMLVADIDNLRKIRQTWQEEWDIHLQLYDKLVKGGD